MSRPQGLKTWTTQFWSTESSSWMRLWSFKQTPSLLLVAFLFFISLSSSLVPVTHASPLQSSLDEISSLPRPSNFFQPQPLFTLPQRVKSPLVSLVKRQPLKIINQSTSGTGGSVINTETQATVPQGAATDGGGTDYDVPALIWIGFAFVVGFPMAIAGFRLWRVTNGVGVGLVGCLASWAAIVNSIGAQGVSDLAITLIALGFFLLGFGFGVFPFGRIAGLFCIGFTGGMAFGVRIAILKPGLLISNSSLFAIDWVLVAFFGLVGGLAMIWKKTQRWSLLLGCASIGTFLCFLGADLAIHKQAGMSRGLRFLFDRNASHFLDIVGGGYNPPMLANIIIAASLGATPLLAFGQGWFFKAPFDRRKIEAEIEAAMIVKGGAKDKELKNAADDPWNVGSSRRPTYKTRMAYQRTMPAGTVTTPSPLGQASRSQPSFPRPRGSPLVPGRF